MIKNIQIQSFRGIRNALVNDLGTLNLFFGKNNCGKSSILESIFLATGISNPLLAININNLRGYTRVQYSDLAADFYNQDIKSPITIKADTTQGSRELQLSLFRSNSKQIDFSNLTAGNSKQPGEFYGIKFEFKINGNPYHSELIIPESSADKGKVNIDQRYSETLFAEYLPSNYTSVDFSNQLISIFENKEENLILNVLQTIDSRICGIALVGQQVMVDLGGERRLPINMMGDGMRKIFSLLVHLIARKDGILLVDEIDNGFHYSVMPVLWKAIINAAVANHIQVFATTHNIDSIKGLSQVCNTMPFNQLALYKLINKDNGELTAVRYNTTQLAYALEQEMEVR